MNIYFVFEGKSEPIVYKSWISVLIPELKEVYTFDNVTDNNFFYQSDMGVPDCYNVMANAVQEINEHPHYDYLVLCTDADRFSAEEKEKDALLKINEKLREGKHHHKKLPENCQLVVIVQKVCIETWFLGNKTFFVRNPTNDLLKKYVSYYDVSTEDPEEMGNEFINEDGTESLFGYSTKALFHEGYLREIFKEHNQKRTTRSNPPKRHLIYRKSNPQEVKDPHFLEQIENRVLHSPTHLLSFQNFISFCRSISKRM